MRGWAKNFEFSSKGAPARLPDFGGLAMGVTVVFVGTPSMSLSEPTGLRGAVPVFSRSPRLRAFRAQRDLPPALAGTRGNLKEVRVAVGARGLRVADCRK
jgi:hypothetical protein